MDKYAYEWNLTANNYVISGVPILIFGLVNIELFTAIENLKHPLGQAWQNGSALAALTLGRAIVNNRRLCGSLLIYEFLKLWFLSLS